MKLPLDDLVAATGAELVGAPPPAIDGVAIDSRSVEAGQLFVAVVAERDGHDFVAAAAAGGAVAALVSRTVEADVAQLVVGDTTDALGAIGALARDRIDGPVVGITGSVGKTTTKDLLASICRQAGPTTASERSFNNELGVPLTLVNADAAAVRTIVEMGARGPGHIEHLCGIARPTVGVVTVVAAAHTEMFGTVDAVADAKGELVEAVGPHGIAVLNVDDERVAAMAKRTTGRVLTVGATGEVRAEHLAAGPDLRARFDLVTPWGSAPVEVAVPGAHNVVNALAAAAAALVTDVALDDVVAGLARAIVSPSRMEVVRLSSGGVVLDDSYNANPTSMEAALEALAGLDAERRVAVVGHMAELGAEATRHHHEIAARAASLGIELLAVGTDLYGVEPLGDVDEVLRRLPPPGAGEAVLLKGSRVVGLDRVAREWRHADRPAR